MRAGPPGQRIDHLTDRSHRLGTLVSAIAADARLAVRSLARTPGFAAVGIAIMGAGLGAAALAFAIIRAVILDPLPYAEPARLYQVMVRSESDGSVHEHTVIGREAFDAWATESRLTAAIAASNEARHESALFLTGTDQPALVRGSFVSRGFFDLLGVTAARGTTFPATGNDDRIAVISHGLWLRAFGGDPAITGRTIGLNGRPATIVGIMPPSFQSPPPVNRVDAAETIEVWLPLIDGPGIRDFDRVLVRLAAGASPAGAEAELWQLLQATGEPAVTGVRLAPLAELFIGDARAGMATLALIIALVLVATCANLGALQITRLAGRRSEIAVRAALGAGRTRVFGHLLAEGLVLALAGGAIGILLAIWGQEWARGLAPAGVARLANARIDGGVIAFNALTALLAGVASTAWPAGIVTATTSPAALAGTRGRTTGVTQRTRATLVFVQVVVATTLAAGSGVMMRTMRNLGRVDTGIGEKGVVVADVHRRRDAGGAIETGRFATDVLRGVRALPGVSRAALATSIPFRPRDYYGPAWRLRIVSSDYFAVLGLPLVSGRFFDDRDGAGAAPVAIIDETLARQQFGTVDVAGREVDERTVIGVVADARHESVDRSGEAAIYVPLAQRPDDRLSLLVRTARADARIASGIRDAVRAVDPDQPVGVVTTLEQIRDRSEAVSRRRFPARVLTMLAGFAALLAALGVYGVTSQTVTQRTREIGIRMSLGATGAGVTRLVTGGSLRIVGGGLAAGVVASIAFTRILSSVLYEVAAVDALVLITVTTALGATALAASAWPARRASAIDPAVTLRQD